MEQEEIIIIDLGASTSLLVATAIALAPAHVILPYPSMLPLHVITIISATPHTLANDLAPQINTIATFLIAIAMSVTNLTAQRSSANQRTQEAVKAIHSHLQIPIWSGDVVSSSSSY